MKNKLQPILKRPAQASVDFGRLKRFSINSKRVGQEEPQARNASAHRYARAGKSDTERQMRGILKFSPMRGAVGTILMGSTPERLKKAVSYSSRPEE